MYFFFQAEDGIRYIGVTGVQTCALPISRTVYPNVSVPVKPGSGVYVTEPSASTTTWPCWGAPGTAVTVRASLDRKSVAEGKSVDLGGRRIINKERIDPLLLLLYISNIQS